MDAGRSLEGRVIVLERQMELVQLRLAGLERRSTGPEPAPVPPPVLRPAPVKFFLDSEVEASPVPSPVVRPQPAEPPEPRPEPARAPAMTEYQVGAKLLPRLGAVMVLLAGLIFVSWGISTGAITAAAQFAGELIVCVAFLALGQWKRQEKEEFGEILTGIGACLLYFAFAGAHVFKKATDGGELISGEVLVGAFIAISFASLIYSRARGSLAFFALGLAGGVTGALLPLNEGKHMVHAALHLLIVASSAAIAVDRKWSAAAAWTWVIGFVFVLPTAPTAGAAQPWWPVVAVTLMGALATIRVGLRGAWDPNGAFVPLMATLGGLAVLGGGASLTQEKGLVAAGLGLAIASLSLLASEEWLRDRALLAGAIVATVIAPFSLTAENAAWTYLALAGCAAGLAGGTKLTVPARHGAVLLGFGTIAWWLAVFGKFDQTIPWQVEALWLVGALAVTGALGWGFRRAGASAHSVALAVGAGLVPYVMHLAATLLGAPGLGVQDDVAIMLAMLPYTALAAGYAGVTRNRELTVLATVMGSLALVYLGSILLGGNVATGTETLLLSVALTSIAAYGLGSSRIYEGDERFSVAGWVLAAAAPFACRLVVVLLGQAPFEVPPFPATGLTLFALATGTALVAGRRQQKGLATLASVFAGAGLFATWLIWVNPPLPRMRFEFTLLAVGIATVVTVGRQVSRATGGRRAKTHSAVVAAVVTVLVARIVARAAGMPALSLPAELMVAATLGLFAAAIGGLGSTERREYWGVVSGLALLAGLALHVVFAVALDPRFAYDVDPGWPSILTWTREVALVTALAAGLGGFTVGVRRFPVGSSRDVLLGLVALATTWLGVRLSLAIMGTGAGLEQNPCATIGLTAAAIVLLAVGFVAGERVLRWAALTTFLIAAAKVIAFDLQAASFGLRVGAFLVLGLAMLGGGYAYIRAQERLESDGR